MCNKNEALISKRSSVWGYFLTIIKWELYRITGKNWKKLNFAVWSQTYDSEILVDFVWQYGTVLSYMYVYTHTEFNLVVDPPNCQIFRLYGDLMNLIIKKEKVQFTTDLL